jgi:hypothetical protein
LAVYKKKPIVLFKREALTYNEVVFNNKIFGTCYVHMFYQPALHMRSGTTLHHILHERSGTTLHHILHERSGATLYAYEDVILAFA